MLNQDHRIKDRAEPTNREINTELNIESNKIQFSALTDPKDKNTASSSTKTMISIGIRQVVPKPKYDFTFGRGDIYSLIFNMYDQASNRPVNPAQRLGRKLKRKALRRLKRKPIRKLIITQKCSGGFDTI